MCLFLCIFFSAFLLCIYIDRQNELIQLKIELPLLAEQVKALEEENQILELKLNELHNPKNLLQYLRLPQLSHLKHPLPEDIVVIEEKETW